MTIKVPKKSSQKTLLRYAVIVGLMACLWGPLPSPAYAEDNGGALETLINSLKDPFRSLLEVQAFVKGVVKGVAKGMKTLAAPPLDLDVEREGLEQAPEQPVHVPVKALDDEPGDNPSPVVKAFLPPLKVTGIIYHSDHPVVIVNGVVLGIGGEINGVKIVGIRKGLVDVRFMGTDYAIHFNDE